MKKPLTAKELQSTIDKGLAFKNKKEITKFREDVIRLVNFKPEITNVKSFLQYLAKKGIESTGGLGNALAMVEQAKDKLGSVKAHRLKKKLRELYK